MGPLTNLALTFLIYPDIVNLIECIYIIGGSFDSKGNILPATEFKFAFDYIATKIVLSNFKKIIIFPTDQQNSFSVNTTELNTIKKKILSKNQKYNIEIYNFIENIIQK
jgi:inosine-uridine nucleoside N-ribohydrolase